MLTTYCVEKLTSSEMLINFGQLTRANLLFLLNVDFSEMPRFSVKGVFQHHRPEADIRHRYTHLCDRCLIKPLGVMDNLT